MISILEKPKDKRSLHDLKSLQPFLSSPGKHIIEFMKKQNVKEKELFNMCTGLKHHQMRSGDFPAIYGDNSQSNRKLMILIDGQLSVRIPSPPDAMLIIVNELII